MFTCPTEDTVVVRLQSVVTTARANGHTCHFNKCRIKNVPVEIHALSERYYIVCKYIRPVAGLHREKTLVKKYFNIYCCEETGAVHWCHAECCAEKILSSESVETCTVTGQQFQSEQVRNYGVASRSQNVVVSNKSDPLKFSRDQNGCVLKTSGVHNIKEEQCKVVARDVITALLFSKARMESERRRMCETLHDAERMVNKYKRCREKQGLQKNYIDMEVIRMNHVRTRPSKMKWLQKTKREQESIIALYTKELIGYWRMVLVRTKLGRGSPTQFAFKTFVPACMYLMKNGINMLGAEIVRRSGYLNACLPETNTLDHFGIQKSAHTATKNNILQAIRETIRSNRKTAQEIEAYRRSESEKVSI